MELKGKLPIDNSMPIDVWQLCVHPVIVGQGLPLFKGITEQIVFKLLKTKTFKTSGHVVFHYAPSNE
jgi:dihydrofolate reductase